MSEESSIQKFYRGCGIFITGATGFLGMALVEKLLRTCPDSGQIFLLIRSKKEKKIEDRLEEITKNKVFDIVRANNPDSFSKLVAIPGDVGEENLGLHENDRKRLLDNVSVVFHCAATLDFEASIKPAVLINLRGTRAIVRLCQEIPKLKAFVHVSSAYVNCLYKETTEKLYPIEHNPDLVIDQTVQAVDDAALDELCIRLIGEHPNTYTFTKLLAEHVVANGASKVPSAIVRPSMITAAWKEPVPGWINSTNGPSGFLMGAAKGIVRRLPLAEKFVYDYIPVDMVINELVVAAWHVGTTKAKEVEIYHCTSSSQHPFRWELLSDGLCQLAHKYPLRSAVWYPFIKLLPSLSLFRISSIFVHFFPAYILDFITGLFGGRKILVRLHSKVNSSLGRLEFFIFNEWCFNNDNTQALSKTLSATDKKLFDFNIHGLNWVDYFDKMALGVRKYLNKEDEKTLPAGKRKQTYLRIAHYCLMSIWYILAYWLLYKFSGGDKFVSLLALPLIYAFFYII